MKTPFIYCGFISFMGLAVLYIFSLPFFRKRYYPLFLFSHIVGYAAFLIGVCFKALIYNNY